MIGLVVGLLFLFMTPQHCDSSNIELLNNITDKYRIGCYNQCIEKCEELQSIQNFTDDCYTVCIPSDC